MKEYDLRVGDYIRRANSHLKLTYAGMPNPDTFCLISNESGPLYFPSDTDKIDFYLDDSDDKDRILKISEVTPKKITLTEIVEESNYESRISQHNGNLRLPNNE